MHAWDGKGLSARLGGAAGNLSRAGLKDPNDQPCPACGRLASGFRALLMDVDATLPEGVDLCRGRNNPAIYIVTERFANAIRELGLTGCVVRLFATPSQRLLTLSGSPLFRA
ncbi:double-CXXCG motif protein [Longimicrobium sp.]|uniref:double-CXXCG motif protein n=1 Tax=Longimicrobium sp. TaxID=2029185 RepID=UPI0039C98873